jgi:hypothetical protein
MDEWLAMFYTLGDVENGECREREAFLLRCFVGG